MNTVRPKKNLGQHFLHDQNIARKIVDSLGDSQPNVLEIGPGTGILTRFLLERQNMNLRLVEIDKESVEYLQENYSELKDKIKHGDFLKIDFTQLFTGNFCIIGNFPYNISSQIFFRILDFKNDIPEVVGMIQKEVAERIIASPGTKTYGILSVLLQAFYEIDYLFTVPQQVFVPPPKVKSAVIRLVRNKRKSLPCNEKLFFQMVKISFNQRRKMLRKSLAGVCKELPAEFAEKRPEQLSVESFIKLACFIETSKNN